MEARALNAEAGRGEGVKSRMKYNAIFIGPLSERMRLYVDIVLSLAPISSYPQ